jgi:hypothetical protein
MMIEGDLDVIAGFREAHAHKIRSYCEEACRPELAETACEAALRELLARLRAREVEPVDVEEMLLQATRSAAAGRFQVETAPRRLRRSRVPSDPTCLAMPELLAAHANGELTGDASPIEHHLERCLTCARTIARMTHAERAFARS